MNKDVGEVGFSGYVSYFSFGIGKSNVAIQIAMVEVGDQRSVPANLGSTTTAIPRHALIKPNRAYIGCFGYRVAIV